MRIQHILLTSAAALLVLSGCSRSSRTGLQTGDYPVTITATGCRIEPSGTKALVDLSTDLIYAYPFSLDVIPALTGIPVSPSGITGNRFTYLMPEPTQDIIFSNLYEGLEGWTYTTGTTAPLMTVTMDGTTGSDHDFVLGLLPESSMSSESTSYPVDLRRKAARVSVNLLAKTSGSDELITDLSSLFSSISLSVNTYSSYQVNSVTLDGTGEAYSGETAVTWECTAVPAGDTATIVLERFILPATSPVLTLTLTSPSGYQKTLEATMSQTISANRNYNLTLTLRQNGSGFDFNIDSFTEQDMDIEFGQDDLVTLSVAPSMLSIDINTKAGEDDTYDGFVLGRDDLYLYCFSAQTDSLLQGYPIPQTSIREDGNYTFRLPQGSYRLAFMNMDVIAPGSKFRIDTTSRDYRRYSNFRLMMDRRNHLSTPFIEGHYDNIVNITDEDVSVPVSLRKHTDGIKVLLNLENPDNIAFSDIVKGMWIGISHFADYLRPIDNTYGTSSNTEFISPAIYPGNLHTVEYDGQSYFLLNEMELPLYSSAPDIRLDILRQDGQTLRLTRKVNIGDNGFSTIIITLNLNDII